LIARVIPLTRTRAVSGLFDYRLAAGQERAGVGSLLRVRFGGRGALAVVVELCERSELSPERLSEPEEVLELSLPAELVALACWMAREYCSTPARCLALMLPPGALAGRAGRRALVAELTAAGAAALHDGSGGPLTPRQRELLGALESRGPTPVAQLGADSLRRLARRGLVSIERRRSRLPAREPLRPPAGAGAPAALTAEQRRALTPLLASLAGESEERRFLLHGVTGSGKTEVYLQAVAAALARGRSAIVLVPEIALTPQTLRRFGERFGELVAVLHSALSERERREGWMALAEGRARVCIGPRSAVLAPLRDLGLVIVDEEHDSSYKHEGDPRYDARGVACRRAQSDRALLVLGSATPRPESFHAARRLRLAERVDGRPLPAVEILDMREHHGSLHPQAREALADCRRAAGKAIVLLNRRGWSNFLTCRSCARVWMCPACEVALVLHRAQRQLACHHCGHRERLPERCPDCGSVSIARHGSGTERIEHELAEALGEPDFPVLRLDADISSAVQRASTLHRFQEARAAVLVGTQMVAKGHDFPDVGLGIVLDADQTLRFPDFRAEERTFALITQLAGRTGRGAGAARGRVLVQTLAPQAQCIRLAARQDSEAFLAAELERRRALAYPPFATLIRVVFSAVQPADTLDAAASLQAALLASASLQEAIAGGGAAVLGPAPLFALRGRARAQLVIKAGARGAAIDAVGSAVAGRASTLSRRGVSVSVDVDPQ
jgi:primosomal protein N' (replication factor Y)